jgi:1-acyl-sn-glycerol-3-phosphate acyltransferase
MPRPILVAWPPLDRLVLDVRQSVAGDISRLVWMDRSAKPSEPPLAPPDTDARRRELIAVVSDLLHELHPQRAATLEIALSSRLERDLGIDSLARTELVQRVERSFRLRLPGGGAIGEVETVGDLLRVLEQAQPGTDMAPQAIAKPILTAAPAAVEARTLIEALDWHAACHPDRLHLTVLEDDAPTPAVMTYRDLAEAARKAAQGLIAREIACGDRVALMLPTSRDFFVAFFGILYAGAVPVPIYPPARLSRLEEHLHRQAGILRNAGARILITVPEGRRVAALLKTQVESLTAIETVSGLSRRDTPISPLPLIRATSTALIQYTSGSTGDPKGVVLSHANLLANIRALGHAMGASSDDTLVSWLPLYHDMGLIAAWLGCLYFAAPFYVMSPFSFLVRPESWLRAIHRFRATLSAAPNFAFERCVSKIDDSKLQGLDLSSLRLVANGAEPVSVPTLRRFIERFGRYGFRPGAMTPVYGLAENSVALSLPPPGRPPVIDRVDRESLTGQGIAAPARADDRHPLEIVSCGRPIPGHEIRIIDNMNRELGDRREGRLEFRGPSATSGYFRNESKTRELLHGGWLDSGDRAYMADGEVYLTGRTKDIIIRAGRHIYPQEIEEAIGGIPDIRRGGVAMFGVADLPSGTERIVILAETAETDPAARATLRTRGQRIASDIAGTPPDEFFLVPPRSVPRTSSGKIRRSAAKELYETGSIGRPQRAFWRQVLRLRLAGIRPQLTRLTIVTRETLYAGWWWLVVGLTAPVAWIAVMVLPRMEWRWRAVRRVARATLAAIGVPVATEGLVRLTHGNAVLVFNHASYTDALLLAAVLPGEPAYAAKREFAGRLFAGPFLRRLGALFVERHDISGSLADTDRAITVAGEGRNLVFFPEGSFTRRAGLSEFYLGAFKVAAEAGLPVLPGVIRGTRLMLRSDQWFPRWAALSVKIEDAVAPSGRDFASVLRLRDATRKVVLAGCGEPDLEELVKPAPPGSV